MLATASVWRSRTPWSPATLVIRNAATAPSTSASWITSERRSMRRRPGSPGPTISAIPSTSRRFETMLPVIVPRTTPRSPSAIAIMAMISSGALPKLALRKPPIPGPVCSAACSVASPITHASGSSASAARRKSAIWPTPNT